MWTTYEVDVVCCKIISPSRNTLHSTWLTGDVAAVECWKWKGPLRDFNEQ
jgi:hypothetical protein